jgi:molecular chaperone HscB
LFNLFTLYNLPLSFNPSKDLIKQQYFQLSRKYHPDFISNGTDEEKEEALEKSSLVNKAYKIFNNQDETIKYVLQLKNLLQEEEKYALPNDFLMEMMELNEELMDAKMEANQLIIDNCKLSIINYQLSIKKEIDNIISAETIDNIDETNLLKVKDYYFKKKYLNRILDSIV